MCIVNELISNYNPYNFDEFKKFIDLNELENFLISSKKMVINYISDLIDFSSKLTLNDID